MFLTIPTAMTWTRIVAIPLIIGVFYLPLPMAMCNTIAAILFMVFAATDWLDRFLARRLNQTSSFGAFWTRLPINFWCVPACWCWCICSAPMFLSR